MSLHACEVVEARGLKLSFNAQKEKCEPRPIKNSNSYGSIKTEHPGECIGS